MTHRWLREMGGTCIFDEAPRKDLVDQGPPTKCKHGSGSCETCGTTNRRDRVHTTEAGAGVVGRLKNKP